MRAVAIAVVLSAIVAALSLWPLWRARQSTGSWKNARRHARVMKRLRRTYGHWRYVAETVSDVCGSDLERLERYSNYLDELIPKLAGVGALSARREIAVPHGDHPELQRKASYEVGLSVVPIRELLPRIDEIKGAGGTFEVVYSPGILHTEISWAGWPADGVADFGELELSRTEASVTVVASTR